MKVPEQETDAVPASTETASSPPALPGDRINLSTREILAALSVKSSDSSDQPLIEIETKKRHAKSRSLDVAIASSPEDASHDESPEASDKEKDKDKSMKKKFSLPKLKGRGRK